MREQIIPPSPRLYQGPRQEKQFRKQRQLLQRQQIVDSPYEQETSRALVPIQEASKAIPRIVVSKPLGTSNIIVLGAITLACLLEAVALGLNGWLAWNTGRTVEDRVLMASLGFLLEAMVFILPPLAGILWQNCRYVFSVLTFTFFLPLFVFAVYNSLGFASLNLTDAVTVRAERITPAVSDAQLRMNTLTTSKEDECKKRGPRCFQLEQDLKTASETLTKARETVSATADPQTASAAKLAAWVTAGRLHPSSDDFWNFKLLVLAVFSQLGGLVLMVSSTISRS